MSGDLYIRAGATRTGPGAEIEPASFRDPAGFVFRRDGEIYRQVNLSYREEYEYLMRSGLYDSLVRAGLLIPHEEVSLEHALSGNAHKVLKPRVIPLLSYPYEWCFSQLKDAALATLKIQREALKVGVSLKDCSAYNVQFAEGKAVFIDTLSFEMYRAGEPWVAYRQFCQHFLAPLALMSHKDVRLNHLLRAYLDGFPLDLAARLLPLRSYFSFGPLLHIHLHARSQIRHAKAPAGLSKTGEFTLRSFYGLIDSLESCVEKMVWKPERSGWVDYYADRESYESESIQHKKRLVAEFLDVLDPKVVWDLGSNTGLFSRLSSDRGIPTVAFDSDPACVEVNYLTAVANGEKQLLPLWMDLTNPSPPTGWEHQERMSLVERGPADVVLALALIHHLAIANTLPLGKIASFLKRICRSVVIEFVPKSDPMVQRLLSSRKDIFPDYTTAGFEKAFDGFTIIRKEEIRGSDRTLYLMRSR